MVRLIWIPLGPDRDPPLDSAAMTFHDPSCCGFELFELRLVPRRDEELDYEHYWMTHDRTWAEPDYRESANPLMSRIVAANTSGSAFLNIISPAWQVPLTVRL